ncbi:MFS transporter, partial [bacterium]|nr:MFS transporter [bacterium]
VIGTLLGAGAAMPIMALFAGRSAGFIGMSAIFGFLASVSLLVTFFSVREPEQVAIQKTGSVLNSLKEVFKNKPYVMLLITWFSNSTAVAIMQTMLIYYYKYIFRDEDAVTLAMITLLVVSLVTIPLWVWLAKKIDKKIAYMAGMTLTLLAVLLFAFFADAMGTTPALILMAFAGVGFSSHYVNPWAMAPDTIEYGAVVSGVRREGVYYSVWTFVIALGGALAGFLVGQGLDLFQYVPDAVQGARSILGMRLLIGVLPAVFILVGNLFLVLYPLSKKRYEEVVKIAHGS